MDIKKDILWRAYLSFLGVVVFSLFVLGRAFYIQNVQGEYWRGLSDSMHQKYVELDAERGTIFTEDGQMLSTSIPYYDIYIDFGAEGLRDKAGKRFRENLDSFAIAVANLFKDKSVAAYKADLKQGYNKKRRYFQLRKGLSFEEYKEFRTFPLVRLGRNKSGVIVEERSKRLNPFGLLARRTIGLSRENAQNVGLERTYDTMLVGQKGKRLVRMMAGGAAVPVEGYEIEPENGKDVYTTLDIHMQDIVETALMKMMVQSESQTGTVILMETKTGKIKAIANLGRLKDGSYSETMNYALQTTEPGSTIKLATLLAVLDHGSSKENDLVEVGSAGRQYVGVRNINDAERSPKPMLTVRECFAHSSNVGLAKIAYKAFADKPDVYRNYLQKFHMDKPTGVDLLGESAPRLPKIKRNKEGLHAMLTAAFGYAIQVSPLQTLMLYNAVANNGKMMRPYLVNSVKANGVTRKEFSPVVLDENLVKPSVIEAARRSMEAVITEGTAKNVFKDFPIPVAGKTGTAHVSDGTVGYGAGVYQASFAGYFPADNPEYSCVVVIKTKPHAAMHYGGQLAAPVFKEIVASIYAQYGRERNAGVVNVVPDSSSYVFAGRKEEMQQVLRSLKIRYIDSMQKGASLSQVYPVNYKPVAKPAYSGAKNIMPDVRYMTLRDALHELESRNIKVTVKGRGKVAAQDVLPGTPLTKNTTVTILLN
ncbi:transpeptidase family protein [Flavisolibacter sp. BT320]|nr:transpeptidase family protein [Flavisolibacter longurius]